MENQRNDSEEKEMRLNWRDNGEETLQISGVLGQFIFVYSLSSKTTEGRVVRKPVNINPGLNVN